jgi:protein SCO1/2
LVNQRGQTVSLATLRGKVVVLAPFLTLCQDECPLVTGAFISLQRDLRAAGQANRVVFVEATVDPGRDTVARLAAYQKEFGADWDLWTGTPADIAAFWKPFGVEYQIVPEGQPAKTDWYTGKPLTYDVDHTDGYILINTAGRERFVDATAPNQKGVLDPKLRGLLNDGGLHELQNPQAPDWTTADALSSISWLLGTNVPAPSS